MSVEKSLIIDKLAGIYPLYKNAEDDPHFSERLKRDLFLFDKVGLGCPVMMLEQIKKAGSDIDASRILDDYHRAQEEFGFLIEGGLAFMFDNRVIFSNDSDVVATRKQKEGQKHLWRMFNHAVTSGGDDIFTRMLAYQLNHIDESPKDYIAIPIVNSLRLPITEGVTRDDVINLTIKKFPQPSGVISWEQLIDFKQNPDNVGRLHGLKTWMNAIGRSGRSAIEINDELEYKLFQYEQSLKIARIKYTMNAFETIIVTSAEFLENAIRLKFSNIAKSFFSIKGSKVHLLESEQNAPGKELSYIVKAREKFGK